MTRRFGTAWWASLGLAAAFAAWTLLVASRWSQPIDEALRAPLLAPWSDLAQVLAGIAIATWPGVVYTGLLLFGWWQRSQRMTRLALALALGPAISWLGTTAVKLLLHRARPESSMPELLTARGWSYPSAETAAAACAAILVVCAATVRRHRPRTVWAIRALAGAGVLLVGADHLLLGAQWPSDLVGGLLWGALAACLALALAKVHVLDEAVAGQPHQSGAGRRAAVVHNPVKLGDVNSFRRLIDHELNARGWEPALWLPTTPDDPGREMVATAVAKDVDLVLGAGGDGTVNVICSGLAGTGIPLGLLPAGTTNLLARNLGIPLDDAAAIRVALDGVGKAIDLVRLVPDGREEDARHSAVIASIGLDAEAFANTGEDLKKALGHAAYFVAGAQQMRGEGFQPIAARVEVDGEVVERSAAMIAIGNVGFIQGGIEVIHGAEPDDGLLNVAVAAPDTLADWARMLGEVLARRAERADIDALVGRRVTVTLTEPHPWQIDGDVEPDAQRLDAEVVPGALRVMLPR